MTVYSVGGPLHLWRECIPVRSHYTIEKREVSSLAMPDVCKRCRLRLVREGWPK